MIPAIGPEIEVFFVLVGVLRSNCFVVAVLPCHYPVSYLRPSKNQFKIRKFNALISDFLQLGLAPTLGSKKKKIRTF